MAGFYFGTSRWDNIPQTLGLAVDGGGVMKGLWQGCPVQAHFTNRYDDIRKVYDHFTCVQADLDPPLGMEGPDPRQHPTSIIDPPFEGDVKERLKRVGLSGPWFADNHVSAEYGDYVSDPERYRAWFDTLTWAANIIMDRRAKNPPEWERAITAEWPPLAQAWGFRLEPRRGLMWGNVGGRETHASVVVKEGNVMTYVQVMTPLPAGSHLSLTHQKSGFWSKLFRGQDINVGDPEFDAAFVIKGEPKEFVHAALTPSAREQIKGLLHAGASISLQGGWLAVWENQLVTDREHLNALMKASCAAADALCHPNALASGTR